MFFRNKTPAPKFETVKPSGELDFDAMGKRDEYLDQKTKLINQKLESVDRGVLVDIFLEIYRKSSKDQSEEKLFRYKRKIEAVLGEVSTYLPESKNDQSVARVISGYVEFNSEVFENLDPLQLLRVFVHEVCHASSIYKSKGVEIPSKEWLGKPSYTAMNEAITEKMADYVVFEYISRSGNKKLYEDFDKEMRSREGYALEVCLLEDAIKDIASETGVSEEVVLGSIFGHYIRNDFERVLESLSPEEVAMFSRLKEPEAKISDGLKVLFKNIVAKVFKNS
jgi:hypothetical protein